MRRLRSLLFTIILAVAPITSALAWQAVDGDTARHDGVVYRLKGFDTPETFQARCRAEKLLGLKAKERLQQLLTGGQWLSLGTEGLDKYGRTLGVITLDGVPLADIMVREGLAVPYTCPNNRCPRRINWCIP